jgi:hypothetical protein
MILLPIYTMDRAILDNHDVRKYYSRTGKNDHYSKSNSFRKYWGMWQSCSDDWQPV